MKRDVVKLRERARGGFFATLVCKHKHTVVVSVTKETPTGHGTSRRGQVW